MTVVEPHPEQRVWHHRHLLERFQQLLADDLVLIGGFILLAWALMLLPTVTGQAQLLDPCTLMEHTPYPLPLQLLLFLVSWQVMMGAMMLPTTLPMVRLFAKASSRQEKPRLALYIFLAAYTTIWTGFAVLTFVGDLGLHWFISHSHWLHARPQLISGVGLLVAGAFQFSPLKERCLRECQHPMSFLMQYYQRGLRSAWNLGSRHGLYCLGCCWALMIVMFAVGVGNLAWMMALTGVMLIEKTSQQGQKLARVMGVILLVWGIFNLLQPS